MLCNEMVGKKFLKISARLSSLAPQIEFSSRRTYLTVCVDSTVCLHLVYRTVYQMVYHKHLLSSPLISFFFSLFFSFLFFFVFSFLFSFFLVAVVYDCIRWLRMACIRFPLLNSQNVVFGHSQHSFCIFLRI